jgi:hypothetical protein
MVKHEFNPKIIHYQNKLNISAFVLPQAGYDFGLEVPFGI